MKIIHIIKKTGKWTGFFILGILILLVLIYAYSEWQFNRGRNTAFSLPPVNIEIPFDSASLASGNHLLTVYGCRECHASDLGGKVMIDDRMLGYIKTSNLTKGKGGLPDDFSDQDWLRALKHGINKDGKPLMVMPAQESSQIPDKDLAEIIAYCKNIPPVDKDLGNQQIRAVAKILHAFGKINLLPALKLEHTITPIGKPEEAVSVDFGATLAITCTGCHRSNFAGGPPLAPGQPSVPDISSTGRIGKWSEEQFMNTLRSGTTPEGHALNNELMPWGILKEYSDLELKALRKYILSFPKNTASTR